MAGGEPLQKCFGGVINRALCSKCHLTISSTMCIIWLISDLVMRKISQALPVTSRTRSFSQSGGVTSPL